MAKTLPAGSMFIDRRDITHAMLALYVTAVSNRRLMQPGDFSEGYNDGYVAALMALASAIGVIEEFAEMVSGAQKTVIKQMDIQENLRGKIE